MATTKPKMSDAKARIHYIPEWADKRGVSRTDIVEHTGAEKGLVSRWFSGTVPSRKYLEQLIEVFELDQVSDLFLHPDEEWVARWFRTHGPAEQQPVLRLMLETQAGAPLSAKPQFHRQDDDFQDRPEDSVAATRRSRTDLRSRPTK